MHLVRLRGGTVAFPLKLLRRLVLTLQQPEGGAYFRFVCIQQGYDVLHHPRLWPPFSCHPLLDATRVVMQGMGELALPFMPKQSFAGGLHVRRVKKKLCFAGHISPCIAN